MKAQSDMADHTVETLLRVRL